MNKAKRDHLSTDIRKIFQEAGNEIKGKWTDQLFSSLTMRLCSGRRHLSL